jgi:hypothetical protein
MRQGDRTCLHQAKTFLVALVLFWFTIAVVAHGQDLSQYDLSTDEGVNAAREAIASKKLDESSKRCISRDRSLPGMVVVGGFASDYGCRFQGVFLSSRYVAQGDAALSRIALEALGWKTANREAREKLAQAWLERGLFAFVTVLSAKNEDFKNHSFQPPGAATRENGETVVTLWIRLPSGRVRGRTYQLREYRFSSDGDFAGSKTLESFNTVKDDG